MSFFEFSSIRVSEESRFLGLTARPPLAKNPHNHPSTGSSLPSWGSIFSDPYRILCFGVSKTHGKVLRCDFYTILPLMLAILPILLAILAPTCPTSARKMPEKCHLGANIAKKVLQPPLQAPQNTKKLVFSGGFCRFSAIQPMCQNNSKMLPTCSFAIKRCMTIQ